MLCDDAAPPSPRTRPAAAGQPPRRPPTRTTTRHHRHRDQRARRISRTCRSRSPRSARRRSTSCRSTISTIMPGCVPSLSFQTSSARASTNVYFRGVASGENANHSASLPSVGTYLDEQPITTTTGALDLHIYDIARVEALAGPQGTLYGASSQAGTIRIITNQPDTSGFYGEVDVELNSVAHGDFGGTLRGLHQRAALDQRRAARRRLVPPRRRLYRQCPGHRSTLPDLGPAATSPSPTTPFVEEDYNDVDTYGARAALRIELDENWTVTPPIMAQKQRSNGSFGDESGLGRTPGPAVQPRARQRPLVPGRADRRGPDRQFRPDLCRRLHAAPDRRRSSTMSTMPISTTRSPATRLFLRQCRQPGEPEPVYHRRTTASPG